MIMKWGIAVEILNAEEVVRKYSDMVYKIAYRHVMNPTDADDVYSEVFLTYFKKDREFDTEEHRKAWLIRVSVNCAKDFLIGKTNHADIDSIAPPSTEDNLDEKVSLQQAINQLPPLQKEVICMFYEHDLTTKQIASILDMSEGNVRSTLSRARERLRTYLEG